MSTNNRSEENGLYEPFPTYKASNLTAYFKGKNAYEKECTAFKIAYANKQAATKKMYANINLAHKKANNIRNQKVNAVLRNIRKTSRLSPIRSFNRSFNRSSNARNALVKGLPFNYGGNM